MNHHPPEHTPDSDFTSPAAPEPVVAELAAAPAASFRTRRPPSVLWKRLPWILFALTCVSTFLAGSHLINLLLNSIEYYVRNNRWFDFHEVAKLLPELCLNGLFYSACIMTILLCHEMGHYLQARRYRVPASLPFFIPMPLGPIGTLGAVIGMRPGVGDRKAIFDIGISGPLAGLVPTIIFCVVGLHLSTIAPVEPNAPHFGDPLLMRLLAWFQFGPLPPGYDVVIHPLGFAGWVGLLITSLNLFPIGQLDGGHILYGLLRKRAHRVARFVLLAATAAVVIGTYVFHVPLMGWSLMLFLLFMMGPKHPPTANDDAPLGPFRIVLGWLTLAFVFVGFTPTPFLF